MFLIWNILLWILQYFQLFNIELLELDWFKVTVTLCVFRGLREADEFSLAFATDNKAQIRFY